MWSLSTGRRSWPSSDIYSDTLKNSDDGRDEPDEAGEAGADLGLAPPHADRQLQGGEDVRTQAQDREQEVQRRGQQDSEVSFV